MYTKKTQLVTAIAGVITAISLSGSAVAQTNCISSAAFMERSCFFEAKEEFAATAAACGAITAQQERRDCVAEAREERGEAIFSDCGDQQEARLDACHQLEEGGYDDPLLDESISFIDPDDIGTSESNNPYVILQAGHTHVLEAEDEIIVVHATDEVREIQGVLCRVVVDIVLEEEFDEEDNEIDYVPIEVTDDWFAQDTDRNVYYCGEVAQNYEDEVLRDLDGSFESGIDGARAGILIKAMPTPGDVHRTEYSLGEAEDIVEYLSVGASPSEEEGGENEDFPCDGGCLKTFDFAPLEPESTEFKYWLPGVGFVLAVSLEDGEIEEDGSERLVCTGDSLDILEDDPDCGIENSEALLEVLCELHDELCADDDE